MPAERILHSIQISTIAHATDDLEKIQKALSILLPESIKRKEIFSRRYMQGHHGNPIVTLNAKINRPAEVEQFRAHFTQLLPRSEKLMIERNLESYSDEEGNLYIRLDKQQAFRGVFRLGDEDPIRVRLKFNRFSGETEELIKKFLEFE